LSILFLFFYDRTTSRTHGFRTQRRRKETKRIRQPKGTSGEMGRLDGVAANVRGREQHR